MTDQPETQQKPKPRLLVMGAPATSRVKFNSPAESGVEVAKPRFLTPELKAKLEQEQATAAAQAAAQAEQDRIAAEEAARLAAEQEAARIAAEQEAARIAAEEAARLAAEQEAARIAAEQEAARVAAEEAARMAAEQEAARIAAEQEAAANARLQAALAQVAAAQKALEEAQGGAYQAPPVQEVTLSPVAAAVPPQPAVAQPAPAPSPFAKPNPFKTAATVAPATGAVSAAGIDATKPATTTAGAPKLKPSVFATPGAPVKAAAPSPFATPAPAQAAASSPFAAAAPAQTATEQPVAEAELIGGCYFDAATGVYIDAETGAYVSEEEVQRRAQEEEQRLKEAEARAALAAEKAAKSKALLRGIIFAVSALAIVVIAFFIVNTVGESQQEKERAQMAELKSLLEVGAQLGAKNVYDQKQLKRSGITVTPNQEDTELLLANVIGKKGHRDNWQPAAHLVCIMAQMDDSIGEMTVKHMKDHVEEGYSEEKYTRMVTLLAGAKNDKMSKRLKDLYKFTSTNKSKKVQKMSAKVLSQMRRVMTMKDADEMLKLIAGAEVEPSLSNAAFKVMDNVMRNASDEERKGMVGKLMRYQKEAPTSTYMYRLLSMTGDPGVLEQLMGTVKSDKSRALAVVNAMAEWPTDDAVPHLMAVWKDESMDERVRQAAHDSVLRVLSDDRDRDDEATLKLFAPLVEDAKTPERRRFLVSALKKLTNRPYVLKLLASIKDAAQKKLDEYEPKYRAAEEALNKLNPGDPGYEEKDKEYKELRALKQGEDDVIYDVEKAQERVLKNTAKKKAKEAEEKE